MEILNQIWDQVSIYLVLPYLLIFMFAAYTVNKYFEAALEKLTKQSWKTVYSVLLIGIIIGIPFVLFTDNGWIKIVFTYTLGTSLHELFFKQIMKKTDEQ